MIIWKLNFINGPFIESTKHNVQWFCLWCRYLKITPSAECIFNRCRNDKLIHSDKHYHIIYRKCEIIRNPAVRVWLCLNNCRQSLLSRLYLPVAVINSLSHSLLMWQCSVWNTYKAKISARNAMPTHFHRWTCEMACNWHCSVGMGTIVSHANFSIIKM